MQIAILGTGKMARGIAYALRETAHDITLSSREAARAEQLARDMSAENARTFHGSSYHAATARADVAFLAVPYGHAAGVIASVHDALQEKILIDLTNPLNAGFDGVATPEGTSASEEIARAAGPRVRVVGALKHTFAGTFAEPAINGGPAPDVLIAGDDAEAKKVVAGLVEAMGFGSLDAGPLRVARTLERMTVLLIDLASRNHWNWNAGFKLLH
ncbi:MAG: NADP oxidoreductase [Myxococcales bacterium]|nr:NADP oxidoreductase [Myxococcales bacterium]